MILHRNTFVIILLSLLGVSCKSREPIDILQDYDVALTNDFSSRYYYLRKPENDTIWTDYRTIYESQDKFVIEEHFEKNVLTSRYKYKVADQTQEVVEKVYYHIRDSVTGETEVVNANIIQHLRKEPEGDYSGFLFVDYYETSMGVGVKMKTECRFQGKENYHYNGRDIESIKLKHQFKMITYFKWLPFYFHETVVDGYVILSKGVGMTYYRGEEADGKVYTQKLISVEELI